MANTKTPVFLTHLSPKEQQQHVWNVLCSQHHHCQNSREQPRPWPTYDDLMHHLSEADYTETLTCPMDHKPYDKTLCPHGIVCCVEVEIFPDSPYTGLLQGGTNGHGILRLSSAMKPPSLGVESRFAKTLLYAVGQKIRNAKLFPCAALKLFREHQPSGNLLLGGSKVGQREEDFFAHCVCTSMTEQMPRALKPFVRKFWTYSDYPLSLGVSDVCQYAVDGSKCTDAELNFPFAIIMKPVVSLQHDTPSAADSFDTFLDQSLKIPSETHLYDIFACPEPSMATDPSKLQRIGKITTSSEMKLSTASDGLFFRHQKKEHDYALRPSWPVALSQPVTVGPTTNTIGTIGLVSLSQTLSQILVHRNNGRLEVIRTEHCFGSFSRFGKTLMLQLR